MSKQQNISQEEFDQIERYLRNELSAAETSSFNNDLAQNPELYKTVEEHRLIFLGIKEGHLVKQLDAFHNEMPAQSASGTPRLRILRSYKFLVAASVILLLCAGAWWLINSNNTNEKLYSHFYSPDPGLITAMGVSEDYTFERAMVHYKRGEYKEALESWEPLLRVNNENDTLHYFIGSAYLASGNTTKAISHLKIVESNSKSVFLNDACWYLGLASLKTGNKPEAISYIERSNHEDKEELLSRLKRT